MKKILSIFIVQILCFLLLGLPALATEEYEFAKDFIEGLFIHKNLEEKAKLSETAQYKSEFEAGVDTMKLVYLANTEMARAVNLFQKYTSSKNETVKETAEVTVAFYKRFIEINTQMIHYMEERYDSVNNPSGRHLGKEMSGLASLTVEKEEVSKALMYCAIMLTHALTKMTGKSDELITHMLITSDERNNLIESIDRIFGNSVKDGLKVGQSYLDATGAALRKFLTSELRSIDQK